MKKTSRRAGEPRPDTRDPGIARRDVLLGALVLAVPMGALPGCSSAAAETPAAPVFVHGIASGDPLADGVILWTRVTTDASAPVDVAWEIASDPAMSARVAGGTFRTDADRDFTVKVDARGLAPGRTYYYRFHALGQTSRVGRTRTTPQGPVDRLRLAVVSCSSYAHGYFHAYKEVAQRLDLDAVVHLGDYIYEYGSGQYGDVRAYEPEHEILTLADYRTRHALYKRDANLQEAHRQHVFITIWDDHETANDSWKDGAENHTPEKEGSFADRKAAAIRAYREWMPIRDADDGRIFRALSYGDLVDLVMLDTRLWARTKQSGGFLGPPPAPDPSRTLLGDDQASWLEARLATSTARWKLLGQQVMVANISLSPTELVNLDQWQGYPESRARLLGFLKTSGVKNTVILTGDIHSSWANEIVSDPNDPEQYDPATGRGSLAVELVTPAITSPGIPPAFKGVVDTARPRNPHVRWVNATQRGFLIVDVTPQRVQGAWFHFDDVVSPDSANLTFASAWSVAEGTTRLVEDPTPAASRTDPPAAAPA